MGIESYAKSLSTRWFNSLFENTSGHGRFIHQLKDPSTDQMQTFSHLNQNLFLLYSDKGLLT